MDQVIEAGRRTQQKIFDDFAAEPTGLELLTKLASEAAALDIQQVPPVKVIERLREE